MHQNHREQDDRLDARELWTARPISELESTLSSQHPCVRVFRLMRSGNLRSIWREEQTTSKNLDESLSTQRQVLEQSELP